jgi:uncharacterized membrane protein
MLLNYTRLKLQTHYHYGYAAENYLAANQETNRINVIQRADAFAVLSVNGSRGKMQLSPLE